VVIRAAGVQRARVGATLAALEARGLKLVDVRLLAAAPAVVAGSAAALARCGLSAAAAAGPVVVAAVEGEGAVLATHKLICAANARAALDAPVCYASATAADADADATAWLGASAAAAAGVAWVSHADCQLHEHAAIARAAGKTADMPAAAPAGKPAKPQQLPAQPAPPKGGREGKGAAAAPPKAPAPKPAGDEPASAYLERHDVAAQLNHALNGLVCAKPADPYGWLAAHFQKAALAGTRGARPARSAVWRLICARRMRAQPSSSPSLVSLPPPLA
jgi:nucleoside diphosphate kinase